jgi:hypothetical protein
MRKILEMDWNTRNITKIFKTSEYLKLAKIYNNLKFKISSSKMKTKNKLS